MRGPPPAMPGMIPPPAAMVSSNQTFQTPIKLFLYFIGSYCSKFSRVRHGYHVCQFLILQTGCSFIMPSLLYERQTAVSCMLFSATKDRLHFLHAIFIRKTDCSFIIPSLLYVRQAAVSLYPVCYTKDRLQFHYTQFVIRKTGCSFIIPSLLYERQAVVSLYPVCYTKDRL